MQEDPVRVFMGGFRGGVFLDKHERYLWIDRARGILILSVVFFHVGGSVMDVCPHAVGTPISVLVDFIGMFFMPAFFLLSGLLWSQRPQDFRSFVCGKARRLLLPYLVFGLLAAFAYLGLANRFGLRLDGWWQPFLSLLHAGKWPEGQGFRFNSPLWFLPCMFVVYVLYWLIDRICRGRTACVVLFFMIVRLMNCLVVTRYGIRGMPWGVDLALRYLQFFMIGAYCSRFRDKMPFQTWPSSSALFFGLLMVVIFVGGVHIHPQLNWLVEVTVLCWLVIFVGIVLRFRVLQVFGEMTMGILLVHKPLISLFIKLGWGLPAANPSGTHLALMCYAMALFVLTAVVSLLISWLLRRFAPWSLGFKRGVA